jgi:hypothetical protein
VFGRAEEENQKMARVIDLECNLPIGVDDPAYKESTQSRPGNPSPIQPSSLVGSLAQLPSRP